MSDDIGQKIVNHRDATEVLRQVKSEAQRHLINMGIKATDDAVATLLRIAATRAEWKG
ncbi:MAG: hypothetical protein AAGJ74_13465 [Pseudomonadota bacterium]